MAAILRVLCKIFNRNEPSLIDNFLENGMVKVPEFCVEKADAYPRAVDGGILL